MSATGDYAGNARRLIAAENVLEDQVAFGSNRGRRNTNDADRRRFVRREHVRDRDDVRRNVKFYH